MLIQEGQTVGWDPRAIIRPISLAERLYVFYTIVVVVLIGVWTVQFWRILGFSSHRTHLQLRKALSLLHDGDFPGLASLGKEFRTESPETGLRAWENLSSESGRAAFLRVINDSEDIFLRVADKVAATLLSLRRLIILWGLLLAVFFFSQGAFLLRGISMEKSTAVVTIAASFEESFRVCSIGLILLAISYIIYWHFSARLAWRRREWEHFCSQAKRLEQ